MGAQTESNIISGNFQQTITEANYDEYRKKLIALQNQFLALKNALKDKVFLAEYRLYLEKKERVNIDFFPSEPFRTQILNPLQQALQTYSAIRSELCKFFPEPELTQMEESIIKAAEDEQTWKELNFFPVYQEIYKKELDIYKQNKTQAHQECVDKQKTIKEKYAARSESYKEKHETCAVYSAFLGIGLPFLAISLTVHAIDKIITSLQLALLHSKEKKLAAEKDKGQPTMFQNLKQRCLENHSLVLKQGFFNVSSLRFGPKISKLDSAKEEEQQRGMSMRPVAESA